MAELPDNIRTGLEEELAGLEGRLAALAPGDDRRDYLTGRIGLVHEALGRRAPAQERRPTAAPEKRPG